MFAPLTDITNVQNNVQHKSKIQESVTLLCSITPSACHFRHDPYAWKCLPCDVMSAAALIEEVDVPHNVPVPDLYQEIEDQAPPAPAGLPVCNVLVQFKCHQGEFTSSVVVEKGQYVVVQGDRGINIGVVIRINNDVQSTYLERTGPSGSVLRHATQREVDYWATDLKDAESVAAAVCQAKVRAHGLPMDVTHAEYQFDKKKLTFYYDARSRIDFVVLLKELYREYGCRIWMEKVRAHD